MMVVRQSWCSEEVSSAWSKGGEAVKERSALQGAKARAQSRRGEGRMQQKKHSLEEASPTQRKRHTIEVQS